MSIPCVLIRKSDSSILKYDAVYPNSNPLKNISGLDLDLEYLAKYAPENKPTFDTRLYNLQINREQGTGDNEFHPTYPNLRQWRITYELIQKSDDEIKEAITDEEEIANNSVFPNKKQLKNIVLALAILNRKINGVNLIQRELDMLDNIHAKAMKIWLNEQNADEKIAIVDAGGIPNLDDGWEVSE